LGNGEREPLTKGMRLQSERRA